MLFIIIPLLCLGAIRLNILGNTNFHQLYYPRCQHDVLLCDNRAQPMKHRAMLHIDIEQSSHTINKDHSYSLLLKD